MRLTPVVLIPAYKPDKALLYTIDSIRNSGRPFEIVVVDDGSGEDYSEIFLQAGKMATVIHQFPNAGKGAALKRGIRHIKENFPDCGYIITADADGQHKVEDIVRISCFFDENSGFVIGARKFEGKVPARSRFGNSVTRGVFRVLCGKHVSDTQTGLRGFSKELFDYMEQIKGSRYEYEMNVLIQCAADKIPINEITIKTVYENNNSSSHFKAVRDSARIYKIIFANSPALKYVFVALISYLVDFLCLKGFHTYVQSVSVCAFLARCISAPLNFLLNRALVFRATTGRLASAAGYAALAGFVIIEKMLLIKLFADVLSIDLWLANLISETTLFVCNYFIQKLIIFRRKRSGGNKTGKNL